MVGKVQDRILNAIAISALNTKNISFQKLREFRGQFLGVHEQLGYGRNILTSHEQLDQYLHSYGNMTFGQWDNFLQNALFHDDCSINSVRIVSYGCGQGLETSILFDQIVIGDLATGMRLRDITKQVVLVEPSLVALARAYGVVKTYCPSSDVFTIQKDLDSIDADELRLSPDDTTIHIFSNVLDIPTFDSGALFTKMFRTRGRHIILAVSHNRSFEGGADRFRSLEKAVMDKSLDDWLCIEDSTINEFKIPNGMPAISWELRLEVSK
jgi:hypothetical protein